ncbi:MAG: enoyl-CoA hydratase-related protein [Acidimicrobiales bacterium]
MIAFDKREGVARLTIDRPEVLNALDEPSEEELVAALAEAEADRSVFVVVLTGSGERAFCAGADMKAAGRRGLDYWAHLDPGGMGGIAAPSRLTVPVLARVNGLALGGGFEMVLGCDLAVACDEAVFGLTEPRVGRLALAGGIVQLPRRTAYKQAMDLLLTGRTISAAEALSFGLLNEVAGRARLDEVVETWVERLRASAPLALRAVKQMVAETAHLSAGDALAHRSAAMVAAIESEDAAEGVRAFREKRPPRWQGR